MKGNLKNPSKNIKYILKNIKYYFYIKMLLFYFFIFLKQRKNQLSLFIIKKYFKYIYLSYAF